MASYKDFAAWAKVAQEIQKKKPPHILKAGVIYWVSIGVNIGSIEDGKGRMFTRPALLISFTALDQLLVVPITSKSKSGDNTYEILVQGKLGHLLFAQARFVDPRCVGDFMDEIDPVTLVRVQNKFTKYIRNILFKKAASIDDETA